MPIGFNGTGYVKRSQLYSVRAAKPVDTEQITGLLDELFPGDPNRPTDTEFENLGKQHDPCMFVAADGCAVAGFLVLRDRILRLWTSVDFIGVDPAHESMGLGAMLTRQALLAAHRPLVRLFVRPSNTRAHRLYIRCGFREVARRRENYPDGEDAAIMMARSARFSLFGPKSTVIEPDKISA